MQFVSIMGAYQTVLNVYFLHFAIFLAIMLMPRHEFKEFEVMYVKSGIEFGQEAEQLTELLNKALWELAWYGHFLVGTFVIFLLPDFLFQTNLPDKIE